MPDKYFSRTVEEMEVIFNKAENDYSRAEIDDKFSAISGGFEYKGAVDYYTQLPVSASLGDAYTVRYSGTSGNIPDGTEYVWGSYNGTEQWIDFSKNSYTKAETDSLLKEKAAALTVASLREDVTALQDTTSDISDVILEQTSAISALANRSAKNLLKNAVTSETRNGVTASANPDGSITLSGASTRDSAFILIYDFAVDGAANSFTSEEKRLENNRSYTVTAAENSDAAIQVVGYNSASDFKILNSGEASQTFSSGLWSYYSFRLWIAGNAAFDDLTFYPMVRPAEIADNTYVPYAPTNRELYEMILALQSGEKSADSPGELQLLRALEESAEQEVEHGLD